MLEAQALRLDWFPICKSHFTSFCDQSNTACRFITGRTEFNLDMSLDATQPGFPRLPLRCRLRDTWMANRYMCVHRQWTGLKAGR